MKQIVPLELETLAGVVRLRRQELGLTQQALGDLLGVDQRTVSAFEKKPGSVSVARFFAFMEVLQLQLFGRECGVQARSDKASGL